MISQDISSLIYKKITTPYREKCDMGAEKMNIRDYIRQFDSRVITARAHMNYNLILWLYYIKFYRLIVDLQVTLAKFAFRLYVGAESATR